MEPNLKHYKAAKVLLGEPYADKDADGIITPGLQARVLTENGQLWSIEVLAFSATKERILQLWDKDPNAFTRINITSKEEGAK